MISPPRTIAELKERSQRLAGRSMGDLAREFQVQIPQDLRVQKGWQGQFIEQCLGADAGNQSRPDFSLINVELKTLPIDRQGNVQESTYVCVVNLNKNIAEQWRDSAVYHKLQHVLWVPVAHVAGQPIDESIIATPFLWQMSTAEESLLRADWEDTMSLVSVGKVHQLNAKLGEVMQVRPKAANSRVLTNVVDERGNPSQTLPRGYYLRAKFTQSLLQQHLRL
ncbi:MAG: DNA mismatch repair endonuclease MutH [Kangiellaceae bacterium]|nr:DNA mismatch repair endonuclease MutH [Kangiellaceae bacterium]